MVLETTNRVFECRNVTKSMVFLFHLRNFECHTIGTRRGAACGFSLDSLEQVARTKSVNEETGAEYSLLVFMIEELHDHGGPHIATKFLEGTFYYNLLFLTTILYKIVCFCM